MIFKVPLSTCIVEVNCTWLRQCHSNDILPAFFLCKTIHLLFKCFIANQLSTYDLLLLISCHSREVGLLAVDMLLKSTILFKKGKMYSESIFIPWLAYSVVWFRQKRLQWFFTSGNNVWELLSILFPMNMEIVVSVKGYTINHSHSRSRHQHRGHTFKEDGQIHHLLIWSESGIIFLFASAENHKRLTVLEKNSLNLCLMCPDEGQPNIYRFWT